MHQFAVSALRSIKKSLVDDYSKLSNWNRGDPCTSNWTGVLCFNTTMDDGYLHLRELYNFSLFLIFDNMAVWCIVCHLHTWHNFRVIILVAALLILQQKWVTHSVRILDIETARGSFFAKNLHQHIQRLID